ncbi:crossover junction endodeoxyribonuclease RuvC [Candidatus Gracilibacteria bacterium]|nr:crossover junction endodeoxyribonuclease RuvC [Candidatus Gracilibacteria bacterium]
MRVIGIDPGIEKVGFAIVDHIKGKTTVLDCGCIKTSKTLSTPERLVQIAEDLEEIIAQWQPKAAGIEELFFSKNVKTALTVAHARGVIVSVLAKSKMKIVELNPRTVKNAMTGDSKANKKQMQKMLQYTTGIRLKNDDTIDAVCIALCLTPTMLT